MRKRQMKKMTDRKRAREEGLPLQSCHVRPVSVFFFFSLCLKYHFVSGWKRRHMDACCVNPCTDVAHFSIFIRLSKSCTLTFLPCNKT